MREASLGFSVEGGSNLFAAEEYVVFHEANEKLRRTKDVLVELIAEVDILLEDARTATRPRSAHRSGWRAGVDSTNGSSAPGVDVGRDDACGYAT